MDKRIKCLNKYIIIPVEYQYNRRVNLYDNTIFNINRKMTMLKEKLIELSRAYVCSNIYLI